MTKKKLPRRKKKESTKQPYKKGWNRTVRSWKWMCCQKRSRNKKTRSWCLKCKKGTHPTCLRKTLRSQIINKNCPQNWNNLALCNKNPWRKGSIRCRGGKCRKGFLPACYKRTTKRKTKRKTKTKNTRKTKTKKLK